MALRRAPVAMLGDARLAQVLLGSDKDDDIPTTAINLSSTPTHPLQSSLLSLGHAGGETQSFIEHTKLRNSLTHPFPVVVNKPVTQDDFVDALTAVMTGKVEFSDIDEEEDAFSFKSLSTICSHMEESSQADDRPDIQTVTTESKIQVGPGQMFFYIDPANAQKERTQSNQGQVSISCPSKVSGAVPAKVSPSPEFVAVSQDSVVGMDISSVYKIHDETTTTVTNETQSSLIPSSEVTGCGESLKEAAPDEKACSQIEASQGSERLRREPTSTKAEAVTNEMHFGRSVASIREMIEKATKEVDRDSLFEQGCAMFREGERLLKEGNIMEARDALQRAHSFQKRSLRLITSRMAEVMHSQGLNHCDRGDKYLAVILLGVSEIIKHRPSAANIHLGAKVHRGYKRVCPKETKYVKNKKEVEKCLKTISEEALPMARTLETYSKALMIQ